MSFMALSELARSRSGACGRVGRRSARSVQDWENSESHPGCFSRTTFPLGCVHSESGDVSTVTSRCVLPFGIAQIHDGGVSGKEQGGLLLLAADDLVDRTCAMGVSEFPAKVV